MPREGKFSPEVEAQLSQRGLDEFIKEEVRLIHEAEMSRGQWLRRQAHFLRRRYVKEWRGTDWPWPGAADIVIPTLDMAIDRLKPVFIRSTVGTRPVVTILARNPESLDKVANLETFMDWLVETRIPRFADEVAYAVDNYLQHGFCVFKVWYDYRTRRVREVVSWDRLPPAIRTLVRPGISPEEADQAAQASGIPFITPQEFAGAVNKDQLRPILQEHFDLDPKDPDDRKAEDILLKWITSKKPADYVVIKRREVWRDTPRMTAIPPEDIVVANEVQDVQDATRLVHRMWLTKQEILERARDNKWSKVALEELFNAANKISSLDSGSSLEQTRDVIHEDRPYIAPAYGSTELYEIWEDYTYRDIDGDGIPEKVVLTIAPVGEVLLRIIELPYKNGKWPFVQARFEHTDKRFYRTRGVPEKLDDLDVEITNLHRQKLNNMTLANTVMLKYRLGSRYNPDNMKFIPGQHVPVGRMDDVDQLRLDGREVSFEREEQILGGLVERYVGVFDASLGEQGRLTRPRTATEIQFVGGLQAEQAGTRIMLWHKAMSEVYDMLWDLWMQWGPKKVYVRVTGGDETELVPMSRYDLQGDFDFVPTPAALNNPATRTQDAQSQLLTLVQTLPYAQLLNQQFEINVGEAVLAFLEGVDSRRARRIMRRRTPEEIQQIQQQIQQQMQAQQQALNPTVQVPRAGASIEDLTRITQQLQAAGAEEANVEAV